MREIFFNQSNALPRSESRHFSQYGISALVSQTSFRGETISAAKCRLFSQATEVIRMVTQWDFVRTRKKFGPKGSKQSPLLGLAEIQMTGYLTSLLVNMQQVTRVHRTSVSRHSMTFVKHLLARDHIDRSITGNTVKSKQCPEKQWKTIVHYTR